MQEIATDDEKMTQSGIICPLEPKDVDKEARIVLDRLLGSEAATEKVQQHGSVAGADISIPEKIRLMS